MVITSAHAINPRTTMISLVGNVSVDSLTQASLTEKPAVAATIAAIPCRFLAA
jgi:hypothetical protein